MKILYFISAHGHGRGGHFHSLNHIASKLGETNEVRIISFGPAKSSLIESNPSFAKHIHFYGINLFHLRKELTKVINDFQPEIYHCFASGCYNIIRLLVSSKKYRIVLNKNGGPNPNYYPHTKNLVLFSLENMEWFKGKAKYRNSNIILIPNRVNALTRNISFNPISKESKIFSFVRIGRIGTYYKKSILNSISLIEELLSLGFSNINLYIIGVVEDMEFYNQLIKHSLVARSYVVLLTDEAHTADASKMLYLADAIIGTGRGLMESASLSIPLLVINANDNIPVLLNKETFKDAFRTNFSERNIFTDYKRETNLGHIAELIKDKNYREELASFSKEMFNQYFNLDQAASAYEEAYKNAETDKRFLLADSIFILHSLAEYLKSWKKLLKNKKHKIN